MVWGWLRVNTFIYNTFLITFICVNVLVFLNPNPLGILARNRPESSKIRQCTFGNMPLSSKCIMHFRRSVIFSTYGLYFLPGSNFAPFVSNSVEIFPKKCPLEILQDLGWLGLTFLTFSMSRTSEERA